MKINTTRPNPKHEVQEQQWISKIVIIRNKNNNNNNKNTRTFQRSCNAKTRWGKSVIVVTMSVRIWPGTSKHL